jgi:hypothetical protein
MFVLLVISNKIRILEEVDVVQSFRNERESLLSGLIRADVGLEGPPGKGISFVLEGFHLFSLHGNLALGIWL